MKKLYSSFNKISCNSYYKSHNKVRFIWVFFFFFVAELCPTLVTSWIIAHKAPLFMGFSRQECWSELPFSSPGDLPDPGIEPTSPACPALAGGFFYH